MYFEKNKLQNRQDTKQTWIELEYPYIMEKIENTK